MPQPNHHRPSSILPRFVIRYVPCIILLLSLASLASAQTAPASPLIPSPIASPVSTAAPGTANSGDTAWMLTSSAFVMLMVPGLALFYAGMVRRKNVLGTMLHSLIALGIIGVEWVVVGYSMAFGASQGKIIGWDAHLLFLSGVTPDLIHNTTNIPELAYIMYQGMFAIITPALIAGSFAERVKFSSYCLFILLWGLIVYNPLAHWVWGGGWLGTSGLGAIDFAGGTVVHISAGVSALVATLYLGKRIGFPAGVLQPNAIVLTLLGAGLLWFGWFGFNGGSAIAADKSAALAFATTQIAAAAGGLAWLFAEWWNHGKPSSLGFASGLVAGLVAITPASGFVPPWAALIIGILAGVVCYAAVLVKSRLGYDDSLDAFGVHGVGGFLGAILTGVFAVKAFGGTAGAVDGAPSQVWIQTIAAATAVAYSAVFTLIIVVVVDKLLGFRTPADIEIEGLDSGLHGEQGWMLAQTPLPAISLPSSAD